MYPQASPQGSSPAPLPAQQPVWIEPAIVLERSLAVAAQSDGPFDPRSPFGPPQFGPYGVLSISGNPPY